MEIHAWREDREQQHGRKTLSTQPLLSDYDLKANF